MDTVDALANEIRVNPNPLLDAAEIAALRAQGIATLDDLWLAVGEDPANGVDRVADLAGVDRERLFVLLGAAALREAALDRAGVRSWPLKDLWRQHWPALLSGVLLIVLAVLGVRAVSTVASVPAQTMQVVVQRPGGLAPFHAITADDLALKRTSKAADALVALSSVVGRYALTSIPTGTTLRSPQLGPTLPAGADMAHRRLLSLPVATSNYSSALVVGSRVTLLFSPRDIGGNAAVSWEIDDALVLAIDRKGDVASLVVAIKLDSSAPPGPIPDPSEVFVIHGLS